MADNERIVVWLRLRDSLRFRRDAHKAAEAVKEIGQAADDAGSPLSQLGGALSGLIGKIPQATGRTRIFGFAVGTVVTAFVALIPLVVGLGGGLLALAGSLGAAALGAGALGVAIAGAALPLGALGLVAAEVMQSFQKVNTAFGRWQVAVGMYGQNSKQAETALARLNSIADNLGGRSLIKLASTWNDFMVGFRQANKGAISGIVQILTLLLNLANQLMPVFAHIAKQAAGALLDAFKALGDELGSSNFIGFLYKMGDVFVQLSGPLARSLINVFMGLVAIASKLAPTIHWLFTEMELASMAFRNWAERGSLGGIVSQFQSWWGLIKAVGGLLITLLSGGAHEGQGMVDALTQIVNRWNAWLKGVQGQKSLAKFFHDAAEMTKAFAVVLAYIVVGLFKFGRALVPIYTVAFKAIVSAGKQLGDAFKPMAPFLHNILFPLLKGLAEGVIGAVVGSFKFLIVIIKVLATVLGFIGKVVGPGFKGTFELIGKVIGFLAGGPILKLLGGLGKISIFLKPLGLLFRGLALPIEFAGAAVGRLIGWIGRLLGATANIAARFSGPFRNAIGEVIGFFEGAGAAFYNAGARLWKMFKRGIMQALGSGLGFAGDIGKGIWNFIARTFNKFLPNKIHGPGPLPDLNLPDNPLPLLAGGGVVSGSGSWITGEAGPEVNTLRDGKVSVVPLTPAVKAQGTRATLFPREGKRTIVTKVYLRGKQIAEAVADEVSDEQARR